MDIKRIIGEFTEYRRAISSRLNDFPDDLKADCNELLEVLASATLSEAIIDSILIESYADNLHSMLTTEPNKENVRYIMLVLASVFYERLLKGDGIETGGPV